MDNRFVSYKIVNPIKGFSFNFRFPEESIPNYLEENISVEDYPIIEYTPTVKESKKITKKRPLLELLNTNISFEELLKLIGANARITSGYRPNATTKLGRRSWHSYLGGAYDIVPLDGNFNRLREVLTTHPLSIAWFRDHDKGILDETTKEMLAKTGGTGAHFHIGPDNKAERFWKAVQRAKSGIKIKKENRGKFTSYCGGKVTNECIQRGKNSSSATIRKRATFAANARKWKH